MFDKFWTGMIVSVRSVQGPALRCLVGQRLVVEGRNKEGCVGVVADQGFFWLPPQLLDFEPEEVRQHG